MEGTYYLQIGTILHDRYEIKDILGAGGFGITYKAWDNTLQTEVCIKEYYPVGIANRTVTASQVSVYTNADEASYKRGMQRFLREARGLAKLGSVKNIVNVHDYFEENNTAYMVMEYLKGKTLKCFVRENGGKVDEDVAIHVACSVLEALQHVHAVGIIHRDISPDNIYICDNMEVKLIDFGALKQEIAEVNKSTSIILKYGFAPPEQYTSNSREQGAWTDIYAVGATVYYILTGLIPQDSIMRMMEDVLVPLEEIIPSISKNFSDAIMKAMSLNIRDRFASAEDFLNALLGSAESTEKQEKQPKKKEKKKTRKEKHVKPIRKQHEKTEKGKSHKKRCTRIITIASVCFGICCIAAIVIFTMIKNQIIDFKSDVPPFEYEDSDLVQETMTLFEQYRDKGDEYLNYYAENGSSFEKSMAENLLQLQEKYNVGKLQDFSMYLSGFALDTQYYKIENYKHSVKVTVINRASNRNVYVTVWYEYNPEYNIMLNEALETYTEDYVNEQIKKYYDDSVPRFLFKYGYSSVEEVIEKWIDGAMDGVKKYKPYKVSMTVNLNAGEELKYVYVISAGVIAIIISAVTIIVIRRKHKKSK